MATVTTTVVYNWLFGKRYNIFNVLSPLSDYEWLLPCAMRWHNAAHTGAVRAGRPGANGGYGYMYTQKYTDQVNQLLTTEATDMYPMHKHCAIA